MYRDLVIKSAVDRCLLCNNAPCTKICKNGVPVDKIIRSLKFENLLGAKALIPKNNPCINCTEKVCQTFCNRHHIDNGVEISNIITSIYQKEEVTKPKADLTTYLCGVKCENPFFLSSSVVGSNYEMVAKAFDMGWAGVAFKTIGMFVPDEVSPRFSQLHKEGKQFIGFKNIEQISDHTLSQNLSYIKKLKKEYPSKIFIASIMGRDDEEWTQLARLVQQAGADIIECNFSCPHMSGHGLGSDVGTNCELVAQYTKATRKGTTLPILAKMTPNITNMELPAISAVEAGADGLAAINTIKSIMNVDLTDFVSSPKVDGKSAVGGYSGKAVKPIALRFIHDMRANEKLKNIPISGMGGIESWVDALEFIVMGCSTIQVTTAVMQYGYRIIDDLIDGLSRYMTQNDIKSIDDIVSVAVDKIVQADELNRSTICFPKFDREKCVSCGRCYLSCYDGGHQAITQNENGQPILNGKKCVGCHLCVTVCPVSAISAGRIVDKNKINK